jgi:hypothetical protein
MDANPYLSNKYSKWYYQIVDQARSRSGPFNGFERHHVIPLCFFIQNQRRSSKKYGWLVGNPDADDNMVYLTPREHFICHWLLTKMTTGIATHLMLTAFAAFRMSSKGQCRIWSSWQYELLKRAAVMATKGTKWWTNGVNSVRSVESPGDEWQVGHGRPINFGKKWYLNKDGQRCLSNLHPGEGWVLGYGKPSKRSWHNGIERRVSEECPGEGWMPGSGIRNNVGLKWWNKGSHRILAEICPGDGWIRGNGIKPASGKRWYHRHDGVRKQFATDPGDGWILGKGKTKI